MKKSYLKAIKSFVFLGLIAFLIPQVGFTQSTPYEDYKGIKNLEEARITFDKDKQAYTGNPEFYRGYKGLMNVAEAQQQWELDLAQQQNRTPNLFDDGIITLLEVGVSNDLCSSAIPMNCGSSVNGTTIGATFDNAGPCGIGFSNDGNPNTSPGVWYSFVATSSLSRLYTCNQASFDTKISVYTGACGELVCVDGRDDAPGCAGFTTDLTFATVPGTTYLVLVHGYNTAVGNFTLTLECLCTSSPATVTITSPGLNAAWKSYGASDPYTFYYGVANAQRLNASVSGGVGPFTYSWSNSGGTNFILPRTYYPASSVDLFEPTGPVAVTCTVTDVGNGCVYVGTRNFDWTDEYFCQKVGNTWYIYVCQNGVTQCVPWTTGRDLLRNNQATLGSCQMPLKTDFNTMANKLSLYPNPSKGLLNIGTYIAKTGEGSLMVMDMRGNTLHAELLNFTEGVWEQTLELNNLASGTYIIRLQTADNVITERFQIIN